MPASSMSFAKNSRQPCAPRTRPRDWFPQPLAGKPSVRSRGIRCPARGTSGKWRGAAITVPVMDQRTDSERRKGPAPSRDTRPATDQSPKPQSWIDGMRRRRRMVLVVTALIIAGIVAVVVWWVSTSGYESTDDAFIDARTVSISSQVNAAIVDVPVTDNQLVEARSEERRVGKECR